MGPIWVQWIFSVACLAAGGYFTVALITRRGEHGAGLRGLAGAEYELSHLGMALGMAAMFAPVGDPLPRLVWVVTFGLAAAWFVSRALRTGLRAGTGWHHDTVAHHVVANVAMLFMLIAPHRHHEVAGSLAGQGGPGHEGHTSAAGGGWLDGPIGTVLTVVLAGYFAVHAGRALVAAGSTRLSSTAAGPTTDGPVQTGPVAVVTDRQSTAQPRLRAVCHVVMDVAMTVMFGLMLWP